MELKTVSIKKVEEDIIHNQYKSGIELSVNEAEEIDNVHITMCQGQDCFIIADFTGGNISFDKSAEEYFTSKGRMIPYTKGIAIVAPPKKSTLLSKVFNKSKTWYPTKECQTLEEAHEWIKEMRSEP
jgi:hypothetical protein